MRRLLVLVALSSACARAPDSAEDSGMRVSASHAEDRARADSMRAPDQSAFPWNRYPRVLANDCIGESCNTSFPAIACREVQLRTAAADTAPSGVTVALNDTVNVTQTDLHLQSPGIVVFRRPYVYEKDDVEGDVKPARDTLHFAVGDTLFLLQYRSLGFWEVGYKGKAYEIGDGFWGTADLPGQMGSYSTDSTTAVARAYPKVSTWWHVTTRDARRGFWKFDAEAWREGLRPDTRDWEGANCRG